jgi:hypothetical protein
MKQSNQDLEEYRNKAFNKSFVMSSKQYNEIGAEYTNPIEKYMRELTNHAIEYKEKALKETAIQGYDYLLFKTETVYENNMATIKSKYQGVAIKMFEDQGFEVYELDKVREYLNIEETNLLK